MDGRSEGCLDITLVHNSHVVNDLFQRQPQNCIATFHHADDVVSFRWTMFNCASQALKLPLKEPLEAGARVTANSNRDAIRSKPCLLKQGEHVLGGSIIHQHSLMQASAKDAEGAAVESPSKENVHLNFIIELSSLHAWHSCRARMLWKS